MKHPIIYSGSSNRPLADKIASALSTTVANVQISRFTNDEARVWIADDKASKTAIVVQSLSKPVDEHLVEFGLICDAVHRLGAEEIIAIVPWLGYSKQDKVFRKGEPLSVKVIAKMLQVVPIKRLYTFDLHNLAILGFFDIPVTNLSARPLFTEYFRKKHTPDTVVIAPDAGAIKASTSFAADLDVPVVYMDKKRDMVTGEVTVMGISRPVEGADVIIIDDMIVTGNTLVETAKYLRKQHVRTIRVGATHHLYITGAHEAILASGIDEIIVTDTISPKDMQTGSTVLSTASLIADELRRSDDE